MISKTEFLENLRNGVMTFTFTKKDGTERVMTATLDPEYIEERKATPKNPTTQDDTLSVFRVFDVGIDSWRSVVFDSIKSVG